MSRRDTIIIAVLVNAGLLMVLFATAFKSGKTKHQDVVIIPPTPTVLETLPISEPLEQLTLTPSLPTLASVEQQEIAIPATEPVAVLPPSAPVVTSLSKPTPTSEKKYATVTVKKGDFLEKIAKANGTTVSAIMKENQLSSTQLRIGQVLKVPTHAVAQANAQEAATKKQDQPAAQFYIVKEGDNPWLIASKNHVKLEELLRLNGLDEQSARRLKPGDRLKIR